MKVFVIRKLGNLISGGKSFFRDDHPGIVSMKLKFLLSFAD